MMTQADGTAGPSANWRSSFRSGSQAVTPDAEFGYDWTKSGRESGVSIMTIQELEAAVGKPRRLAGLVFR